MTKTKKRYKDKCKSVKVTFYIKDMTLYETAVQKAHVYGSIEKYVKTLIRKDISDDQQREEMEEMEALNEALAFLDERK